MRRWEHAGRSAPTCGFSTSTRTPAGGAINGVTQSAEYALCQLRRSAMQQPLTSTSAGQLDDRRIHPRIPLTMSSGLGSPELCSGWRPPMCSVRRRVSPVADPSARPGRGAVAGRSARRGRDARASLVSGDGEPVRGSGRRPRREKGSGGVAGGPGRLAVRAARLAHQREPRLRIQACAGAMLMASSPGTGCGSSPPGRRTPSRWHRSR